MRLILTNGGNDQRLITMLLSSKAKSNFTCFVMVISNLSRVDIVVVKIIYFLKEDAFDHSVLFLSVLHAHLLMKFY